MARAPLILPVLLLVVTAVDAMDFAGASLAAAAAKNLVRNLDSTGKNLSKALDPTASAKDKSVDSNKTSDSSTVPSSSTNVSAPLGLAAIAPSPVDKGDSPPPATKRNKDQHLTREFLESHNSIRRFIGEEPFVWNATMARLARRFLNSLRDTCHMVHSNIEDVGENIFWGFGSRWGAADAVRSWAQEHSYYDATTNACLAGRMCGHYTQIIWRRSLQIGCARVECTTGDVLMSCNYLPSGNYVGETPFQTEP